MYKYVRAGGILGALPVAQAGRITGKKGHCSETLFGKVSHRGSQMSALANILASHRDCRLTLPLCALGLRHLAEKSVANAVQQSLNARVNLARLGLKTNSAILYIDAKNTICLLLVNWCQHPPAAASPLTRAGMTKISLQAVLAFWSISNSKARVGVRVRAGRFLRMTQSRVPTDRIVALGRHCQYSKVADVRPTTFAGRASPLRMCKVQSD